jgi:hypothetical protein
MKTKFALNQKNNLPLPPFLFTVHETHFKNFWSLKFLFFTPIYLGFRSFSPTLHLFYTQVPDLFRREREKKSLKNYE